MMKELFCDNITYASDTGRDYDFNTCDKVNELLVNALVFTGQLVPREDFTNKIPLSVSTQGLRVRV